MEEEMKAYLPETWKDPRIELGRSPISGDGMFASQAIRKGEAVVIVGGAVMTEAEFEAFQAMHSFYNFIQIDKHLYLVEAPEVMQSLSGSNGSMNHSCDSNTWMEDEVTLVARRDIEAGEEVTIDYALFTTQSNWMLDNRCHCGSPHCRRVITGDDWMRKDVQERYRHHFSPYINRRIEKRQARE
jgi:SET domain-containing protein